MMLDDYSNPPMWARERPIFSKFATLGLDDVGCYEYLHLFGGSILPTKTLE